jgi:photosystem II stability/assembly factor-like uncharacterized protein
MAVTSQGRVLVGGDNGTLLISNDRGISWSVRAQLGSYDLKQFAVHGDTIVAITGIGSVLVSNDGGEKWQARDKSIGALAAVVAVGDATFIAIDEILNVLRRSDDGGTTWQSTASEMPSMPVALSSVNAGRVLAVAADGSVFSSTDLGRSWQPHRERAAPNLRVIVADGQHTIAAGDAGVLLESRDGGDAWQTLAASRDLFNAAAVIGTTRGLIVGARGTILLTRDGGESWEPQSSGTVASLSGVDFATRRRAVIAGPENELLLSTDGGAHWSARKLPGASHPRDVAFSDAKRGIAVGDHTAPSSSVDIFVTRDGGDTWSTREALNGFATPAIDFADAQTALVTGGTAVGLSSDGGQSWQRQSVAASLSSIRVASGRYRTRVFVPAAGNAIWQLGATSRTVAREPWERAKSAAFIDADHGVIVGRNGTILRTEDGGKRWSRRISNTALDLNTVHYFSADRLLATASGRVFSSDDGGDSWQPVQYDRYPSPWLWLAAGLLLTVAGWQIRARTRRPEIAEQRASILDAAASDRPIGWRDPDPAGLRDIALGLSSFLRNRRTEAPLTIAVTGEWGTGKSSLMNLLRHDLQRAGFRPVWFNAWHHQSGENLLGSLLANIHAQAVPPLHTVAGWDFRLTLLGVRAKRFWLRLALTLFLITTLFFCYDHLGANAGKFMDALLDEKTGALESFRNAAGLLGFLAAVLAPLVGALRAVSAFGLQPGKLIAAVATPNNDEISRQQAGARYRFAREFADFTEALDPRTLVIFIDDLDRCRPENVVEVLEAVNFLVSSGRCVIVLGMARRWVETCVGLAFKELAVADSQSRDGGDDAAAASNDALSQGEEQRHFARNYLEKLINIEIRVPKLSSSAARAILQGQANAPAKNGFRYAFGSVLLQALPIAGWIVGAVLIVLAAANVANRLDALTATASVDPVVALLQPAGSATNGVKASSEDPASTPSTPSSTGNIAVDIAEATASPGWYLGAAVPVGLACLAFLSVLLFARKEVRTDDSPAFREALAALQPWILLGGHSPRSLKRFINHLRYLAMRFRSDKATKTTGERMRHAIAVWFGRETIETPVASAVRGAPPEEVLVALAAIYRCNEQWLEELTPWREERLANLIERDFAERIPDEAEREQIARQLVKSIEEFNHHFTATPLFIDAMSDRRHLVAFYEVMAAETVARPLADSEPPAAAQLRSA